MPTVIDDNTGEEVEVRQVEAVAAVANISQLSQLNQLSQLRLELPPNAAELIEQAMVQAINKCMEEGVSDPKKINARMMEAREAMKKSMYIRMNDLRSQEAAAAKEK